MTFTYTEIFEGRSPLQAGYPVNAIAGGVFGMTSGLAVTEGYITSNLTSCKLCIVNSSLENYTTSGAYVRSTSNNVIQIGGGEACSGTYLAFGI